MIKIPDHLKPYLEVENPTYFDTSRYLVTPQMTDIISDIQRTMHLQDEMKKLGLVYLNTTLMYGPPGTGKTSFTRYIAHVLKREFIYVNFSKLFDGILGKTTAIISDIFEFMADKDVVFMLDEIDCISQKRGTEGDATGGEISRITVCLMQNFDILKKKNAKCILIAATNRVDIMDPALRSRFTLVKELRFLTNDKKEEYIRKFLDSVGILISKENVSRYVIQNSAISQRNIEQDLIRCIATWIDHGRGEFILDHIKEGGLY